MKAKRKLVFMASTSEVYGKNTKVPFTEGDDVTLGPTAKSRWSYAASKALDEFLALPQTETVSDMHCVTQWSRYDNHWKGVAAHDILALVQPAPEAKYVIFTSFDGYTTNIRLDQFHQPDVFLVHE